MNEYQKEAILISFFNDKERYKRLAEYIVHLISDDPSSPKESLHTIIYRIKDELRIIEKIDKQNDELEDRMDEVLQIIRSSNGIEFAQKLAQRYISKAREALEGLPAIRERKMLLEISDFIAERTY